MNRVNSGISLFGKGSIFGAKTQMMKNYPTVILDSTFKMMFYSLVLFLKCKVKIFFLKRRFVEEECLKSYKYLCFKNSTKNLKKGQLDAPFSKCGCRTYPTSAKRIPAATALPSTPATLGPIACISKKL